MNDRIRMIFGFAVLAGLVMLAILVTLTHMSDQSAVAFDGIVEVIGVIGGAFAVWAFAKRGD